MPNKQKVFLASLAFACLLTIIPAFAFGQHKAFKPGERLKYSIYYGPIRGGEAILEVRNGIYEDKKVNHLYLNGKTVGLANVLYNVDDTYQSFTNPSTDLPYKSIRDIKEGSYKHYSEQIFDHWTRSDSTIVYSTKVGEVLSPKNSNDILSAFYYLRNQLVGANLKMGDTLVVQTYFSDEIYALRVRFMGYENVKTKLGTINCIKLVPIVITGRVFKNKDDMTVWFSNDKNFLPVRIRFNIIVGAAYCDLIDYKGLMHPFTSLR
ncbi:MAG: DUF3108 domain-containing protein [Tenuifilaceae bacterium]|nr:DUF3108 domain-containing protein [Tenuifilaceae bacterium]